MGRLIEFHVPRNFRRNRSLPQPGHKARVLKFKMPVRKIPPDDWRILGLAVSDLAHVDSPRMR
jgi:hypothetical protein